MQPSIPHCKANYKSYARLKNSSNDLLTIITTFKSQIYVTRRNVKLKKRSLLKFHTPDKRPDINPESEPIKRHGGKQTGEEAMQYLKCQQFSCGCLLADLVPLSTQPDFSHHAGRRYISEIFFSKGRLEH